MFCTKCGHNRTEVINSRGHKKSAEVWRRRRCPACSTTITTIEKPGLERTIRVCNLQTGAAAMFSMGKLIHSISSSFIHDKALGVDSSPPLAETIVSRLIPVPDSIITTSTLVEVTYDTLSKFDSTAALHYGLAHGLIKAPRLRRDK